MLKVFEYFDAHRVPTRVMHERNRGWQRFLIAMFMPPLALLGNQESSAAHRLAVAIALASAAYGLASLVYLAYLRRRPTGGVVVQYLFTVLDPLLILMVFMQDPRFFAFAHPLLAVIIIRSGIRYGERTAWPSGRDAGPWLDATSGSRCASGFRKAA